jgi:hypothetical protein
LDDEIKKSKFYEDLTPDQQETFGDRFLDHYQREILLDNLDSCLTYLCTKNDKP